MKVRLETTIELRPHEIDAAHIWYLETAEEGESFRDWLKSNFVASCDYFVMSAVEHYGEVR